MGVIGSRLPLTDPPGPDRPLRPVNGSCVVAPIGLAEPPIRTTMIIYWIHTLILSSGADPVIIVQSGRWQSARESRGPRATRRGLARTVFAQPIGPEDGSQGPHPGFGEAMRCKTPRPSRLSSTTLHCGSSEKQKAPETLGCRGSLRKGSGRYRTRTYDPQLVELVV